MGKGDQRSKRGKLYRGTFGKTRPSNRNKRRSGKAKTSHNDSK
jgi:ribosomal small subunit protein bTHX